MALILINDEDRVFNGRLSVTRSLVELEDGSYQVVVQGQLATHRYFEDITSIESKRYQLEEIEVYQENYGSEDFDIVYSFRAGYFRVKSGESHLDDEEIEEYENEIYNEDGGVIRDE